MATREELLDPTYVPYEGELRFVSRLDGSVLGDLELQQYQSRHGWLTVPVLKESELPE